MRSNPDLSGSTADADWEYCQHSLEQVSRTFTRPIEMLPDPLRVGVTCGYLLCRITDTIEDLPHLSLAERDLAYRDFLLVLERDADLFEQLAAPRAAGGEIDPLDRSVHAR